ncbi:Hypothetical predicted protein, partial [Marmota monax]
KSLKSRLNGRPGCKTEDSLPRPIHSFVKLIWVLLVKQVPQDTEGARGRCLQVLEQRVRWRRVPGSAPTAQWTAPAPLTSSLSQSLNQADSRASSQAKAAATQARGAPPPPSD